MRGWIVGLARVGCGPSVGVDQGAGAERSSGVAEVSGDERGDPTRAGETGSMPDPSAPDPAPTMPATMDGSDDDAGIESGSLDEGFESLGVCAVQP